MKVSAMLVGAAWYQRQQAAALAWWRHGTSGKPLLHCGEAKVCVVWSRVGPRSAIEISGRSYPLDYVLETPTDYKFV